MIKRKDGRWQEQVKLPGMSKPKYFYGKTQKEVRRKMAEWSQAEEEAKEKAVLFETVADEWEKWHTEQVGWLTGKNYEKPIREVKDYFAGKNINDIYADEVSTFLELVGKKGYSKRTVQARKTALSMIFDYAIQKRITKINPVRSAKMPNGLHTTKRESPTDAQMEKIMGGFGLKFGLFAAMQCYTGMRRGELLALEWGDIDIENNVIYVNKSVEFIGDNPHVKKPKTENGKREIILVNALKDLLPRGCHGVVFPGKDGQHMKASEFKTAWGKWCAEIGLATKGEKRYTVDVTSHQLRHQYASMLYDAGVGVKDAQELLGHADIKTTMNVYTHISRKRKAETADKLNLFLCQNSEKEEKDK